MVQPSPPSTGRRPETPLATKEANDIILPLKELDFNFALLAPRLGKPSASFTQAAVPGWNSGLLGHWLPIEMHLGNFDAHLFGQLSDHDRRLFAGLKQPLSMETQITNRS